MSLTHIIVVTCDALMKLSSRLCGVIKMTKDRGKQNICELTIITFPLGAFVTFCWAGAFPEGPFEGSKFTVMPSVSSVPISRKEWSG